MSNSRAINDLSQADQDSGPVSPAPASCQYSTATAAGARPAGRTPGCLIQWAWLPIALAGAPGCLLVNRGSQQPGTMVLAVIGFFLLYIGLRFLLARIHLNSERSAGNEQTEGETPAIVRFFGGVLAGLVIFLA